MPVRSAVDRETSSPQDRLPDATATDSSRALRTLVLVAAGAVVVAYALDRVLGSSDEGGDAPLETIRERTVEAAPSAVSDRVPDAVPTESQPIPIGGVGSDEEETDERDERDERDETDETEIETDPDASSGASASGAGEPADDAEMNVELADDPSSAKITSGSSDEIQEKPAEPGELSVEEEVEDVIDEDVGAEDVIDEDVGAEDVIDEDVGVDVDADESSTDDGEPVDNADTNDSTDDEE